MNILQVVMALDYGGVESYVVRISRAMVELGHQVTVLTTGGPVEKLLDGTGVELIHAPLKSASVRDLSCKLMPHGFDIINGHNYNGGRVARFISKHTGIPSVMTVHGPRPFLKRVLFNGWSPHVIALSGGDKRGIMGPLGIPAECIFSSFYAVDPDKHRPLAVSEALKQEFIPEPGGKLIVHISRFSNRKAKVALELLDALPMIARTHPGARLLIVGSGPMFSYVKECAAKFNSTRTPMVRVESPRLDVSELFNLADVMVATATTSMEAMACGAPLIAAGRTGYFGLIDTANFDAAHDLLFADHGQCARQITAKSLSRDILHVFENEAECRLTARAIAERMARDFSPRSAAESLLGIYTTVSRARIMV